MKKAISQIFYEDNSVNDDSLILRLIKGILFMVIFVIYIGESSVLESLSFKALIYFLVLAFLIYMLNYFKIHLFSFKKLTVKDISIIVIVTIVVKLLDYLFSYFYAGSTLNQENIENSIQGISVLNFAIFFALLPALLEEIVFRGIILRVFFKGHLFIGLIVSSVLFGLVHEFSNWIEFLPYFYSGLFFGIAYLMTRRIEVVIFIHFLGNFTAFFI